MNSGSPSGRSLRLAAARVQSSPEAMNGPTLQRKVTITNPLGFHLRPIAAFARLAAQYQSTVTLANGSRRVNGKSALELMLLAAEQGTELILDISGSDAAEAIEALSAILVAPSVDDEPDDLAPPKG